MAEVYCGSEPCPLFLNSTCVFYTGESLLYIGVQNNDTLEAIIVKINQAFQNAGVGYAFTNGLIQPTPFQPVQLGGALIQNTTIGGNFTLTFAGNVQAARHITTGGSSSQFVKGDGTLDSTAYQPAANYITGLSGDATASGPGVAAMTLSTVNFAPGTFGNGNTIPVVTVNNKGLVTNITPVAINLPPLPLNFIGDVVGSGFTGSNISLLLQNVNANPYNTITPLKFKVNGKGLVTGASPITASDIVNILGYNPGTSGTSGSAGSSGTSGTTGTSGTSGTSATSGTSGTTGTSGTSATSGTSGTSGTDGTGGTSGTSGSTGTSGTSGTSGTAGTSGTSGTTGTSGSSGTSGSTGTSGSSGTTGTSGSSGTTGTSGSSGTSGTTGTSGSSGTSGTTGLDGSNGTSGTSGTTGTSGSSGTSGTTGTSGSSGTSGTTGTSGTSGLSGDRFKTTSTTPFTLLPAGASGTITVDPGLSYTPGQSIIIAYDANNHDEAEVTAYDPNTGSISFVVFRLTGSGTYSNWFVNIDGASGGDGSSGTSGTTGTSGSSGTSGTTGSSGSSGTSGTSATDGTSGTSGTTGVDGTSGSSGTSGTTGTSGSSGTSGTTGTSGSSGTSGTSATDGTGGTSGTSGSSGTSGTTGTSGTSATSGTSGTSATSGTTGTSGTSGTNGTGGTSGTSGTSATSGTSGTSGATGASGTSGTSGTSVAVSGTTNTMAKFTSATTIGNSALTDDGSTLTYTGQTVLNRQNSINVTTPGLTAAYGLHFGGQTTADLATGITFSSGDATPTTANAGIYVQGSGAYGSRMYIATTDSYATGSKTAITINESGNVTFNRGTIQNGSVWINNGANFNSYNENIRLFNAPNGVSVIAFSSSGVSGMPTTSILGYSDRMEFRYGNGAQYRIYDGYTESMGTSRATAFIDSQNTAFYLDPNATSISSNNAGGAIFRNIQISSASLTDTIQNVNSGGNIWLNYGHNGPVGLGYGGGLTTAYAGLAVNGTSSATGDMRAPIFYDSNNTAYYLDPESGSILGGTSFRTTGQASNTPSVPSVNIGVWVNTFGFIDLSTSDPTNGSWIDFTKANGTDFSGRIRYHNGSDYLQLFAGGTEQVRVFSSNAEAIGSFRAPIFYDSNDTTYYVDPGTNILSLNIRGGIRSVRVDTESILQSFNASAGSPLQFYLDHSFGNVNIGNARGVVFAGGTYWEIANSVRSPIFYDSNNTGYYVDPSSTTSLRTVGSWRADSSAWDGEFNGKIQYHSNNWYFQAAGEWLFRNSGGTNVVSIGQGGTITANGDVSGSAMYASNWFRTYGNSGWYSQTYGGGWFMEDSTWIRSYGSKSVYVNTFIRAQGSFRVGSEYSIWAPYGTYSSYISRIAYLSFDWDSAYDSYSNHGIASTNRFGSFSDNMSINSYNDINLRIDTNDNDASSYVRFHHHTTGENQFAYIGYNSCISQFQMFLAGQFCTNTSGYCYNDGYFSSVYGSGIYGATCDYCALYSISTCGIYITNYGAWMNLNPNYPVFSPPSGECFVYDGNCGNLYIGGNICQNWYSDCKYKENITEIDSALDKIDALRGVEFDWNELGEEEVFKKGHEVGLIAQEVQVVYPQAVREVSKEREDHVVTALVVDYDKFTPLIIQSIKELNAKVDTLKSRIDAGGL